MSRGGGGREGLAALLVVCTVACGGGGVGRGGRGGQHCWMHVVWYVEGSWKGDGEGQRGVLSCLSWSGMYDAILVAPVHAAVGKEHMRTPCTLCM